jgi:hypothetical protein
MYSQGFSAAFAFEVLVQTIAQTAGIRSNNVIVAWIVVSGPLEDCFANASLAQAVGRAH